MATYVPNATQTTEPVESQTVESAALEFRTLKTSVNGRVASLQTEIDTEELTRAAEVAALVAVDEATDYRVTVLEQLAFNGSVPGTVLVTKFVATASQTAFALTVDPLTVATVDVFINGVYQNHDSFTVSGNAVTLNEGVVAGYEVEIKASIPLLLGVTNANLVNYTGPNSEATNVQALAAPSGSSLVGYLPAGTGAVATTVQTVLREKISIARFGVLPSNTATVNTPLVQLAVNYGIQYHYDLEVPPGEYLINGPIKFVDDYATDYGFPRLDQITLRGQAGSKFKADTGFVGAMFYMGDSATSTPFKGALFLDYITLDGGNQEIKLLDALPAFQARFYADKCNFLGVTGATSYALDTTYSSAWLRNCVLQGSGTHTTNGIGIVAKYTSIVLENCFISYFGKAVEYANFAEATVQASNCLFQINAVNLNFEGGGYLNNTSTFKGCYFVETKPGDLQFNVTDKTTFGSLGNLNFVGCQFDGYNADAATPLLDLDFGNVGAFMSFTGCNAWTASAPIGTFALKIVAIGQYTTASFENCSNLDVTQDTNPAYAKFADVKAPGNSGGTSTAGFNERTLNTASFNKISGCSLSANKITLQKGVYRVSASAPAYNAGRHRLQLFNNTKASAEVIGRNAYCTNGVATHAELSGRFALNEVCELRLLHHIELGVASLGLGVDVPDGSSEIYTEIEIWKEA